MGGALDVLAGIGTGLVVMVLMAAGFALLMWAKVCRTPVPTEPEPIPAA